MLNTKQKQSKFITLEGIEGVGKSTAIACLAAELTQRKIEFVVTREPGGTAIAEQIRALFLATGDEPILPVSELLLMFAARAQHIAHVIKPALAAGRWVLCDRFTDASFAYQGGGGGLPLGWIEQLEKWVGDLTPDRTILLHAPVSLSLERLAARKSLDRIEQAQEDFFSRASAVYCERAKRYAERYRIVDATQPLSNVEQQLRDLLDELITCQPQTQKV